MTAPTSAQPTWLTTDEAAAHLRMSTRHLLRLARTGRIRGEQLVRGGHWRFRRDWLDGDGRSVVA